jgi:hypothetical protein
MGRSGVLGKALRISRWLGVAIAGVATPGSASAGPPYLNDDPQPTDPGHWEIYNYISGSGAPRELSGEAGFDLNYGAAKDLQLTAVLPLAFDGDHGFSADGLRGGPGDVQLAVKYRALHQTDASWLPDVAVFPRLFVPTASPPLGTGRLGLLLPIWAQKDAGPWSVFGGGGYQINPGPGQDDFWQGGMAVSRTLGSRLSLGAEMFGQSRQAADGPAFTAVNFAATYKLVEHWSLLASAGPTWSPESADGYVFYFALKADY